MTNRFLDPMAPARTFAARRAGMTDGRKLRRDVQRLKRRVAPSFGGEDVPAEWSMIEEVDELPEADDDTIGRIFVKKNEDADDIINFGISAADGTPVLVSLNPAALDDGALTLSLASAITGLSAPTGTAIDASGNSYVVYETGSAPSKLRKYTGALAVAWTKNTSVIGHAATDGAYVYTTDRGNDIFYQDNASTGVNVGASIYGSGSGNGQLNDPFGITTSGAHVWVVDSGNNRVQKFTVAGSYVSQFGSLGAGDGEFDSPTGIALAGGKLYVLDAGNARIQRFDAATHAHEATLDLGDGNADGQISAAEGIAVDSDGNIWIADTGNHRVQVFDAAGAFLAKRGSFGSGSQQLKSPRQIALDANDVGYIADSGNDRISTARIVPDGITPVITVRTNTIGIGGNANDEVTASCAAGEAVTGGGCSNETDDSANFVVTKNHPSGQGWRCRARNTATGGRVLKAWAVCLATPI